MNKNLCIFICFLVGILVYSLIRSYCSCNVIEGQIPPDCIKIYCDYKLDNENFCDDTTKRHKLNKLLKNNTSCEEGKNSSYYCKNPPNCPSGPPPPPAPPPGHKKTFFLQIDVALPADITFTFDGRNKTLSKSSTGTLQWSIEKNDKISFPFSTSLKGYTYTFSYGPNTGFVTNEDRAKIKVWNGSDPININLPKSGDTTIHLSVQRSLPCGTISRTPQTDCSKLGSTSGRDCDNYYVSDPDTYYKCINPSDGGTKCTKGNIPCTQLPSCTPPMTNLSVFYPLQSDLPKCPPDYQACAQELENCLKYNIDCCDGTKCPTDGICPPSTDNDNDLE